MDYQLAAIESACDIFRGQETSHAVFTVSRSYGGLLAGEREDSLGIGNRPLKQLLDEQLLANLHAIQLRNGLPPSQSLNRQDLNFTVEMETGTGKTYVYLRTIFELNKRYGFTKFVIVVPSVAIKEGVYKSMQIMAEHFRGLYTNIPFEYFLYDSSCPEQVRNFATSPHIQIMVVTVGAINKKDVNNLYKSNEKTNDYPPITLIQQTRPIVIVDEPQSVDGGMEGQGKKALGEMHPLCTLRYSATHVDKHHRIYRLDAVDAYEQKLVKQIEVASLLVEEGHNRAYVKLLGTDNQRGITARVELDCQQAHQVKRMPKTVKAGDNLEQITGRSLYAGYVVLSIHCKKGEEALELASQQRLLRLGEAINDVDHDAVKRQMIRRTIEEHLDKELRLRPQGIKVLSLFFVDTVEHYRAYSPDGIPTKGKYALMFEEEYRQVMAKPKYAPLRKDKITPAEEVHQGYFSIDRKKIGNKTVEMFKNTRGDTKADDDTYNLIMRDKEKLLSFDTPLKFIFSHSALREGWDNPNVFQICVLRDMGSEMARRQSIGRGLRLCVNQQGERLRGFDINTLTVIANESYEQFAETLQQEIEKESGIRFGIVESHQFAAISTTDANGQTQPLGFEQSKQLFDHLQANGHLDAKGKIQDSLRRALKEKTLELPPAFQPHLPQVREILRKLTGKLEIKDAAKRGNTIYPRQAILQSEAFQSLWNRIKHKTTYRLAFDNEQLIADCIHAIQNGPPILQTHMHVKKADLTIGKGGVETTETMQSVPVVLEEHALLLPDVLSLLQDQTQLTRNSLVRILIACERLEDFKRNPQRFIELASETINRAKRLALVDGVRYQRIGDDHYYAQELLEKDELRGYLTDMLQNTQKSLYEHVVYDSAGVERSFAEQLEKNEAVRVYAKLPAWFRIPTPLGTYNPDWAVLVEKEGMERIYFVVETKSGLFADDVREKENAKIACGKAHFQALAQDNNPARYVVATRVADMMGHVSP
ncbi:MAG: DEAD/DEAH box helicase family protein [Magnetococcales bacterium]|nr:DEAD/DEAH box helicase family protein [Magnetococcales bacterium]